MDYREVTLESVNSGAIIDLFEEEFEKLVQNIADDNTEPDKVRSITIQLSDKPSKDRSKADTKVSVTSKLAPLKPHESYIVLSTDGKKVSAYVAGTDIRQADLTGISNIRPMPAVSGGEK